MALIKRFRGKKTAWNQPPFWTLPDATVPYAAAYSLTPDKEPIENDFEAYATRAYKSNPVVFGVAQRRSLVFSEARFQWQNFVNGRPRDLFGTPELSLLENPWPGGTTGELLTRMEQDVTIAGNFYATKADNRGRVGKMASGDGLRIVRMRPDKVTIIIGSASGDPYALDARIIGYLFDPSPSRGMLGSYPATDNQPEKVLLTPEEVCHYSPIPDPMARFRGMSWLTPVLLEIQADTAATTHKAKFFENGATPNMVVKFDKETSEEDYRDFVTAYRESHQGAWNAYKTLFLMGGADVSVVGADLRQLDFKTTQGAGETRIAMAADVPAVLAGISEGLQGSSLNQGNFNAAKRQFVDGTMRPLWRMAAASLATLVKAPRENVRLTFDDRDINFLREDRLDQAEIMMKQASTVRTFIDSGWDPDAAIDAVSMDNIIELRGNHSGLVSVQMQPIAGVVEEGESTDQNVLLDDDPAGDGAPGN